MDEVTESYGRINQALEYYKSCDGSHWDGRVKAIIITKLEEALLWESKLIKTN
jgi:hypothetical protein